jgi:hypothetical protein
MEDLVLELGAKVMVKGVISRKGMHRPQDHNRGIWKYWERIEILRERKGILVGYRVLSNGIRDWGGEDDGIIYTPKEHFKAVMVVFSLITNPVYCRLEDVRNYETI